MTKRKSWTKAHAKKLVDIMIDEAKFAEDVLTCAEHKDSFPSLSTYYRQLRKDEQLKADTEQAREIVFDLKAVELERLSLMSDREAFVHYGKAKAHEVDDIDYKEASNFRVYRIRQIQYELAKIAPVLTKKYNQKLQVEHSGETKNQFEFLLADFTKSTAEQQINVIDVEPDS